MKNKTGELNGFLDRGSSFHGELEFEDTMRINGRFNGKIMTKNELIVGESAQIEGEVHAGRIAISGTVIGKIIAAQRVEIHRNGRRRPLRRNRMRRRVWPRFRSRRFSRIPSSRARPSTKRRSTSWRAAFASMESSSRSSSRAPATSTSSSPASAATTPHRKLA